MPLTTQTERAVDISINRALHTHTINPADWFAYLKLKAEASALEKRVKALEQSFGLPEPAELAEQYSATPGETLTINIVNGNGDFMGKLSVFYYPGATIGPSWRKRLS